MNRRAFLTSMSGVSGSLLAGCLGWGGPTSYEECPQNIVLKENLPPEAEEEVTMALADGVYETDGHVYITDVMDTDEAYIEANNPKRYYELLVEKTDGTTRISSEEVLPTGTSLKGYLGSDLDETVHVSVLIEADPYGETFDTETVVDDEFELGSGDSVNLIRGDVEYGSYTGVFEIESESKNETVEESWDVDASNPSPSFLIGRDPIAMPAVDTKERSWCEWTDDGEVVY